MEARPLKIYVYQTPDGDEPFTRWFDNLKDLEAVARIARRLDRLELGNWGDCKPIGEAVSELRIDYGPGYRVYVARDGNTLVILLCGGDKKTQKKDIKTAQKYWRDYKGRKR